MGKGRVRRQCRRISPNVAAKRPLRPGRRPRWSHRQKLLTCLRMSRKVAQIVAAWADAALTGMRKKSTRGLTLTVFPKKRSSLGGYRIWIAPLANPAYTIWLKTPLTRLSTKKKIRMRRKFPAKTVSPRLTAAESPQLAVQTCPSQTHSLS